MVEDVIHLLLYCSKYDDIRQKLFDDVFTADNFIKDLHDQEVIKLLLPNDTTITMLATVSLHNAPHDSTITMFATVSLHNALIITL